MYEIATFAAGCFWGVEESFLGATGIISTRVGYCGGRTDHPTYRDVCSGDTGHAEAVEVTYDADLISYSALLKMFWECHDPTQINRQGPDFGEQYRSAIFFHSESQREFALLSRSVLEMSGVIRRKIVTQIVSASFFWEAEAYHQKYLQKNSGGCGF